MKTKIVIYILILLYIIYIVIFKNSVNLIFNGKNGKQKIDKIELLIDKTALKTDRKFYQIWNFPKPIVKKPKKNKKKIIEPTLKGKEVCLNKNCYKVMAIKNGIEVILYSKLFKPHHIKTFKKGNKIDENLTISKINNNSVFIKFLDKKSYKIEFFDINVTKYKPKEREIYD